MNLWLILLSGGALLTLWLGVAPLWHNLRRRHWQRQAFPPAWRNLLERRLTLYRRLPEPLRQQLHGHIQVLLREKPMHPCNGLALTESMRVLIAAQASLLLLNRRSDYYPGLREILVYPDEFIVEREASDGTIHYRERRVLSGESWDSGKVVLSWYDVEYGLDIRDDEVFNVVLHEFAHQLDQESGGGNGAPRLSGRTAYVRWAGLMQTAYDTHCARIAHGDTAVLGEYACTSPAEFFAVASEAFFQQSRSLRRVYPGVYELLCEYYRVDPAAWA